MSAPAVTRAVAALEQSLGVSLLTRTTRYVRPTDAGLRYLDDARQILSRLQEADESVAGINATTRPPHRHRAGFVRQNFVMPHVVEYLQRYEGCRNLRTLS